MSEGFWEREDFEDMVVRSLMVSFELDLFSKPPPPKKGITWVLPPWRKGTIRDLANLRSIGPYIPPADREMVDKQYWYEIDGLPDFASFAYKRNNGDSLDGDLGDSYVEVQLAEKIDRFPRRCVMAPGATIAKYRISSFFPKSSGIEVYSQYIGIKKSGLVISEPDYGKNGSVCGNATLQFYADRKHLWNVTAIESPARAIFGVHKEQIKSLFYARSLPLTKTGRKRPILHWVRAHQRRIKEGVEIDIKKHLRGIESFEMNGTVFMIDSPRKKVVK